MNSIDRPLKNFKSNRDIMKAIERLHTEIANIRSDVTYLHTEVQDKHRAVVRAQSSLSYAQSTYSRPRRGF